MKVLHRHVTIGKYEFGIIINRDIVADSFERFPDMMEMLIKYSNSEDGNDAVVNAIKDKKLKTLLELNDQMAELVKYAFPKMLALADEFDHTKNAKKSKEIIEYVYENDAENDFVQEMFKFICLGFTPETTEKKTPKVAFKMM